MKLLFPVVGMLLLVSCSSAQNDMCENHVSATTPLCSELFQAFQAALVKSKTNLFNLRKIFFPSSQATPVLVNISYVIDFGNITDIPCTNDSNNTLNTSEKFHKNFGWTSTIMYTVFHPATINRFQPQLFYEMMKRFEPNTSADAQAAFYWEGLGPYLTLELLLHIPSLSCSPSYDQVSNSLKDMTLVLKTYAQDQGNLTEWKDTGAHVLDGRVFAHNWWDHEYEIYGISSQLRLTNWFVAILATIALSAAFTVVIYRAPKKKEKHFKFHHSLLWSSTGTLFFWWIILYTTEIVKIHMWHNNSQQMEFGLNITWLILAVLFIPLCSCVFSCITYRDILSPGLAMVSGLCCGCCLCNICDGFDYRNEEMDKLIGEESENRDQSKTPSDNKCNRCLRTAFGACPLVVFFFSTGFVIINIVPVVLYFLIYSIRVVAFYSFILTAFVLFIFVVTAVDFERKKDKQKKDTCCHELMRLVKGAYIYPCVPFITLTLLTVLFVTIYRTLVSGSSAGTNISNLFKALIPTIILGSPAIWAAKKLKKYYEDENNTGDNGDVTQEND